MSVQKLVESLAGAAQAATERNMPMCYMFGVVMGLEPLQIQLDNQRYIEGDNIVVMRHLRAQEEYVDHHHTIKPVDTTIADKHKHKTEPHVTHLAIWHGLEVGDKVVLLRNAGGQEYLILGRV